MSSASVSLLRQLLEGTTTVGQAFVSRIAAGGHPRALVQRTQRDIVGNTSLNFMTLYQYYMAADAGATASGGVIATAGAWSEFPMALDMASALKFAPSRSGELLAVLTKRTAKKEGAKEQQFLDVWRASRRVARVPLDDVHGKVATDSWFGTLQWSADDRLVMYVAEPKAPELGEFWKDEQPDAQVGKPADTKPVGVKFDFKEDWGETFVGVRQPRIFVCEWETGIVRAVQGIPEDVSAGQPVFTPDGASVCFVGWAQTPRRLGVVYCFNRPSRVYVAPLPSMTPKVAPPASNNSEAETKSPTDKPAEDVPPARAVSPPEDASARTPRFSPCGKYLAYLSNVDVDTHNGQARLLVLNWPSLERRQIAPVVENADLAKGEFPGLFVGGLPNRCWSGDSAALYMTTHWGSQVLAVRVALSGTADRADITPVDSEAGRLGYGRSSWVLDVLGGNQSDPRDLVLFGFNTPTIPDQVALTHFGTLPAPDVPSAVQTVLNGLEWQVTDVTPEDGGAAYQSILLKQSAPSETPRPLIVAIHGGPHGSFNTSYMTSLAFLANLGFGVLMVNYRGSIGFGSAPLRSLLGKIGTQDVADVMTSLKATLATGQFDGSRVAAYGGSHGGFLGTHVIGQHAESWKAAIVRNPVTNVAAMSSLTDIPDWCWVEAGIPYDYATHRVPTTAQLVAMWEASPARFASHIKAATMIMLGAKDLRVPPGPAYDLYHVLRAANVPARLIVYPDDVHSLSSPATEADSLANIAQWLQTHV